MIKNQQKLERFAERELRRNMHSMIVPDEDGSLVVFGQFRLILAEHKYQVYNYTDLIGEFSTKKIAMGWCVAEKYRQLNLSRNIEILDRKRSILADDIACRQKQAERSQDASFTETVNTKIEPKIISLNSINRELEKCLISAKYLQIRGFNNET